MPKLNLSWVAEQYSLSTNIYLGIYIIFFPGIYIFFHHSFFHLQTLVIGQFSDVGSKRCRGSIAKRVEFRGTFGSPSCNGKLDFECVLTIIVSPPKIQNFHYLTIWILKELLKNLSKCCDDFYVFIRST